MIVVAYYTKSYLSYVGNLIKSLNSFHIPYSIRCIEDQGSWQKNTQFKPRFILGKMKQFHPQPIVYVDVDAIFMHYPMLFDQLNYDIGVHVLNHHPKKPEVKRNEMLSGTLYFGNTERSKVLVQRWIDECEKQPDVWDQKILQQVIGSDFYNLPQEYCTIFDDLKQPAEPVIVHYQASRKVKSLRP